MTKPKHAAEDFDAFDCSPSSSRSFYAEYDDGWSTPCCGIWMWGDIIENETICPYCEKTFVFDEEEDA